MCHHEPMQITIDAAGRVVIPKQVRDRLGLAAGSTLELEQVGDHVELRPVGREVWIDDSDGRLVARTAPDAPRLTARDVRDLVDRQRR